MRIAVLGGSGFIGSHVVEALCAAGHQVTALDWRSPVFGDLDPRVELSLGDWRDPDLLRAVVQDQEVVLHLISTSIPATANRDVTADVTANVIPSLRLFELCREAGVRRLVFASSGGGVYGRPEDLPIPETHRTRPLSAHAVSKLVIERYLELFGLEPVVLRLANPYGQRQSPMGAQGAVAVFLGRLAQGEPLEVWGDGSVVRDYLHVADVAQAFRLAVEAPEPAGICNIGSGDGLSLSALIARIAAVTGTTPEVRYSPGRAYDVPVNVLDIRRARERLGWAPEVELDTGLRQTWQWIQELGESGAGP